MGYTHYWTTKKNISKPEWTDIRLDFFKVLPKFFNKLDQLSDQKLIVDKDSIYFNGVKDNGHETFVLNREKDSTFCKTARKPYDIAVCCALIIAKQYTKDNIEVCSDGMDFPEWTKARNLCQKELGYGKDFRID